MGVDYDKKGHIAYITINNPDRANTMDQDSGKELNEAYAQVWDDRDVRVAILTAVGDRFFSAGHVLGASKDQGKPDEKPPHRGGWDVLAGLRGYGNLRKRRQDGAWLPANMEACYRGCQRLGRRVGVLPPPGRTTDIRIACEEHGRFQVRAA